MEISRVVFFCDDRKVGQVLRMLTGIALQIPEVTPVTNAKVKKDGLAEETRGKVVELFEMWLKKKKITEVNSTIGREFCTSIGKSEHTYGYVLNQAKDAGLLRKTGKSTNSVWKVIR